MVHTEMPNSMYLDLYILPSTTLGTAATKMMDVKMT